MSELRAVLWDMDGVLVDTGEFHFQAWAQTLAGYGLPFDRAAFRTTFGWNNLSILTYVLGQEPTPGQLQEIADLKEQRFRKAIRGRARLLPGVLDWMERLKATGVRQALASSAPPANIDALVDELSLRAYFQAVVSGETLPGKPDPSLFLQAARELEVAAARCIVVEDAVAGVDAARRAGMKVVAVTTTSPPDALSAADVVVEHLDRLPLDTFDRLWKTDGKQD